ncbi:DUF4010 domain-containing protein [Rubrivivax rivuli]|uniref:DUF4010 domain-containing protein n=1 Tax=Rubrivivax rivuli TaxID=1862385 RepID=A0A437R8J2_9BURK|nr:DUF4010 domain-containing protein [Rubrivivax rivuli]RVU43052.1 DUF4010 domain-containing protein [Rubrivivax rivuli]
MNSTELAAVAGSTAGTATGLAAALGAGLLIGLERERRKGRGAARAAAGIRSFTLAAVGGGIAMALGQPLLVALGGLLVVLLSAVAYWKSREAPPGQPAPDPGLTTELALFITYLVGVLGVQQPALGAGAAVVVAALLAAREKLHRFATELLSQAELHDALLLAALALVLLPLVPAAPLPWLGGVAPRTLMLTVVLILALQAAGHVAWRLLGPRAGLALSGLFSGFVSSTATIASMGARARTEPAQARACLAGALFSTAATWVQVALLCTALAPAALATVAPSAAAGVLLAAGTAAWAAWAGGALPQAAAASSANEHGPLRLREALAVAALLGAVAVGVAWAQRQFGNTGLLLGTALAALADAHAPVAAAAARHGSGAVDAAALQQVALVAVGMNALTRTLTAFVAGGRRYGLGVGASLALSTGAALAVALITR